MEKIIYEFNRFKERDSVYDDERKYASYLATILDPTYEIIMPTINLNSILLLFVQKTYKGKTKPGLFFAGTNKILCIFLQFIYFLLTFLPVLVYCLLFSA